MCQSDFYVKVNDNGDLQGAGNLIKGRQPEVTAVCSYGTLFCYVFSFCLSILFVDLGISFLLQHEKNNARISSSYMIIIID